MSPVISAARISAIYLMIKYQTFYTKGVVYLFDKSRFGICFAASPSPHPPPINYQPKKKYLCLSAGNISNTYRKEPL
jgi:hypothetical protein